MEFYAYAFASSLTSSCSSTTSITSSLLVCLEISKKFTFEAALKNIVSIIIALVIGIVGILLGAINGAIIGQQSENRYFRGAVVGAVSGALLSIEVFESFLRLWSSQGKGIECLVYLTLITPSTKANMEFYAYAFASSSSSSCRISSSTTTITSFIIVCQEMCKKLTVKAVVGNSISMIVALFLGIVGTLLGTINGAIIGQQSENRYFRGAAIGAFTGALLSIEVFESFLRLWSSHGKGIQCLLYLGDVLISLVNGKIVRERVGPILTSNRRPSQSTGTIFEDTFENSIGSKGLSLNKVEKIPWVEITSENHADSFGQNISCSVCLEDFQVGEEARTLPHCNHMFHPNCIDQWLIKCGSCPQCRRNL